MKLYDSEHPYHCEQGHYFGTGTTLASDLTTPHRSWADFIGEMGTADLDYNLLFRWDWKWKTDDYGEPLPPHPDPNYRDGELWLFYFVQRKGYHYTHVVDVCRADEPAVRAWLLKRWDHMRALWAPFGRRGAK